MPRNKPALSIVEGSARIPAPLAVAIRFKTHPLKLAGREVPALPLEELLGRLLLTRSFGFRGDFNGEDMIFLVVIVKSDVRRVFVKSDDAVQILVGQQRTARVLGQWGVLDDS